MRKFLTGKSSTSSSSSSSGSSGQQSNTTTTTSSSSSSQQSSASTTSTATSGVSTTTTTTTQQQQHYTNPRSTPQIQKQANQSSDVSSANSESWFPSESSGKQQSEISSNTANIMNSSNNNSAGGNSAQNGDVIVGGGNQSSGGSAVAGPGQQRPYTIPGVLHYLQYEWNRFEQERQQWDIERAELNARIALLQGERKGQENLKKDLVRRIKMLEYCLRQERARYHKLKFGTDPPPVMANGQANGVDKDDLFTLNSDGPLIMDGSTAGDQTDANAPPGTNGSNGAVSWKHGRQLLRQYLQEIGYTDTIIDVRSNRVRSLLGLTGQMGGLGGDQAGQDASNNNNKYNPAVGLAADQQDSMRAAFEILDQSNQGQGGPQGGRNGPGQGQGGRKGQQGQGGKDSGQADEDDEQDDDDEDDMRDEMEERNAGFVIDSEVEEVIAEFDFLHGSAVNDPPSYQSRLYESAAGGGGGGGGPGGKHHGVAGDRGQSMWQRDGSKDMGVDIGELAGVTVANESAEPGGGVNGPNAGSGTAGSTVTDGETRKTWSERYILKSHFDCVRSLKFHHNEPLLVTCSEDETIKLWNLTKTQMPSGKGKNQSNPNAATTFDLEPVFTYRGHHAPVVSLELYGNTIFTGAANGELYAWQIPETIASIDPYEPFNAHFAPQQPGPGSGGTPHTDAVWSLALVNAAPAPLSHSHHPGGGVNSPPHSQVTSSRPLLVSASADNTLKLWDISSGIGFSCVKTVTWADQSARATCVVAIGQDSAAGIPAAAVPDTEGHSGQTQVATLIAVSFSTGIIHVYDVDRTLGHNPNEESVQLPPLFVIDTTTSEGSSGTGGGSSGSGGTEKSSRRVNSIVVHPSAPILVSAHTDRTIRFWDLKSATCTHSMVAHLDEVSCLATDPNGLYLLSGSHDCSIRLWNLDTRTCVQEITSHRKKFDESIFDVTFHPSRPLFATAGADGLAKVFV